jgi:hypothetical protein
MSTVYVDSMRDPTPLPGPGYGPFLPMLILAVAVAGWFGFQTVQLWKEHDLLVATITSQEKLFADSQKVRDSLDSLARQIGALADSGNASARLVVDELKRRGITFDPKAPPPTAPTK